MGWDPASLCSPNHTLQSGVVSARSTKRPRGPVHNARAAPSLSFLNRNPRIILRLKSSPSLTGSGVREWLRKSMQYKCFERLGDKLPDKEGAD